MLSVLPYRLHTETKAEWVNLAISEWDAAIDLSPFFNRTQPSGEYYVKAVIYHVHPAAGPVDLNSGHYVAYVKQAQQWHLANDNKVSPVLMSGLRGLPCLLVLERKDRPGADLPAKQVQQPAAEIPVPDLDEQPEASPSEHDGSSSETDATSSDHDSTPSEAPESEQDKPPAPVSTAASSSGQKLPKKTITRSSRFFVGRHPEIHQANDESFDSTGPQW